MESSPRRRPPYFLLLALTIFLTSATTCRGFNITRILAQHPEFSTFNHYLSATHLADEINRRMTITVLAIDNSAMNELLGKHLSIFTLKNVLSLHVLADYFGAQKLHQITGRTALVATLFQATGKAPGTSGFVNVTDIRGGRVAFGAADEMDGGDALGSSFVKSVQEIPYKIAVIQISHPLSSPVAEAPAPSPASYNLTELMVKKGCNIFAGLVSTTADVEKTFKSDVVGGLTVFCPIDQAMEAFDPKWKNLTAEGKASLLLYHGLATYNSLQMLKDNNGVITTLATDSHRNFNFTVQDAGEVLTLRTKINTATITGTVIDEQPLAIYTIDKVLEPRELFKVPELADAPAPAPAKSKAPPKKKPTKAAPGPATSDDSAADSPDDAPAADDTADTKNGAASNSASGLLAAAAAVAVAAMALASGGF